MLSEAQSDAVRKLYQAPTPGAFSTAYSIWMIENGYSYSQAARIFAGADYCDNGPCTALVPLRQRVPMVSRAPELPERPVDYPGKLEHEELYAALTGIAFVAGIIAVWMGIIWGGSVLYQSLFDGAFLGRKLVGALLFGVGAICQWIKLYSARARLVQMSEVVQGAIIAIVTVLTVGQAIKWFSWLNGLGGY